MGEIKRTWDLLTKDERRPIIEAIVTYFSEDRNEKIGIVAAEAMLDFFLRTAGGTIYNKALEDIKPLLEKQLGDTLFDIDTSLRKQN